MSGIFITRGASLTIPAFTIDLDNIEGSTITPMVGFDIYPAWLRNAMMQARMSQTASVELESVWDGKGSEAQVCLLEQELTTAMGSIVAAAAAIDGFYGSVEGRSPTSLSGDQSKKSNKNARERIILSTFQQRFSLSNEMMKRFRKPIGTIFRFRGLAVHSHGRPEEPIMHPRLQVGMSPKHVIFRAENAVAATDVALKLITYLSTRPSHRYKALRKHCSQAREWLEPLVLDWETDHESLEIPLPLVEMAENTRKARAEKSRASATSA